MNILNQFQTNKNTFETIMPETQPGTKSTMVVMGVIMNSKGAINNVTQTLTL